MQCFNSRDLGHVNDAVWIEFCSQWSCW